MGNINQWHKCKHGAVYRDSEKPVCALCDYSELRARLAAMEKHMEGIKDYTEACNDRGIPLEEWLDRARQILKGA